MYKFSIKKVIGDNFDVRGNQTQFSTLKSVLSELNFEQLDVKLTNVAICVTQKMFCLNNWRDFYRLTPSDVDPYSAMAILETETKNRNFSYCETSDPVGELVEFFDYVINKTIINEIFDSLKRNNLINTILSDDIRQEIAEFILTNNTADKVDKAFIEEVGKVINIQLNGQCTQDVLYVSVGCGSGYADMQVLKHLTNQFPNLKAHGFDPHYPKGSNHFITENIGLFSNRAMEAEGNFLSQAKRAFNMPPTTPAVAIERYAFHHTGKSSSQFRNSVGYTAPLISLEEPIAEKDLTDLFYRSAAIAYDIIANHSLAVVKGGNWIEQAFEDYNKFNVLYRRVPSKSDTSVSYKRIQGVWPRTAIMTYS